MRYFKVVGPNNEAIHGGTFTYKLGEWTPAETPLLCRSGYHVVDAMSLVDAITATLPIGVCVEKKRVYEVEVAGPSDHDGDGKYAFSSIRLVRGIRWDGPKLLDELDPACETLRDGDRAAREAYLAAMEASRRSACEQLEHAMGWDAASKEQPREGG